MLPGVAARRAGDLIDLPVAFVGNEPIARQMRKTNVPARSAGRAPARRLAPPQGQARASGSKPLAIAMTVLFVVTIPTV